MMFTDPERPHLGGFVDGPIGDEATYFPGLWTWLVNDLKIESVVDVGCGSGIATNFFETLLPGAVMGIDGIPQKQSNIVEHDFTDDTYYCGDRDLIWCCEFLEHIEEKYLPNVLETFLSAKAKYILITHAFPGQAGHWHVNCRTPHYWIGAFAAIGYRLDEELTKTTRGLSCLNLSAWNHFKRSGMVFTKN